MLIPPSHYPLWVKRTVRDRFLIDALIKLNNDEAKQTRMSGYM
jgi:hypothetical protein